MWSRILQSIAGRIASVLILALCIAGSPSVSFASDYPTRPVRIIIPFSAGGAPDIVMRVVAEALRDKWKQPVVVENRPGAHTFLGTLAVTRSAPDGYTLLFTADGTFVLNPLLYKSLPYSMSELTPVTLVAITPHVLAVSNKVKAQNVREFVTEAKAQPDKMTFGTTGPGSIQRLAFEFFSRITGVQLVHVPYRGAAETAVALVAGEIHASINGAATVLPHVSPTGVRALAVSTKKRSALVPDMPTIDEAGAPGFSSQGAFGLLAPAGVPQDIRKKLAADIAEVMQRPQMAKILRARYFELAPLGAAEFEKLIAEESEKWRATIEEKKIRVE